MTPDKVKSCINTKTNFRDSPQNQSQAVVCINTPRMYPQSKYILVTKNTKVSLYVLSTFWCFSFLLQRNMSNTSGLRNKLRRHNFEKILAIYRESIEKYHSNINLWTFHIQGWAPFFTFVWKMLHNLAHYFTLLLST